MNNELEISNKGDLWTIKVTDQEGIESLTLYTSQLAKLKTILASIEVPLPEGELPL